jgi:hypothetical protein
MAPFIGTCASKNGTFSSKLHFWKHIPSCARALWQPFDAKQFAQALFEE